MSLVPLNEDSPKNIESLPSSLNISTINPMDRRIAPRVSAVLPIGLQIGESVSRPARTINISATGVRLVLNRVIARGVRLKLTMSLPGQTLELFGQTVWEENLGEFGTQIVGVAFDNPDSTSMTRLAEWLRDDAA